MQNITEFETDLISRLAEERDKFHKTGAEIFGSQVANIAVQLLNQQDCDAKDIVEVAYNLLLDSRYFYYKREQELLK